MWKKTLWKWVESACETLFNNFKWFRKTMNNNNQQSKSCQAHQPNNKSDPTRVLLTIKVDNQIYAASIVAIKNNPAEFFYHMTYPKEAKRKLKNITDGNLIGRPDHMSFHKDGRVHMYKNKESITTDGQFPDGSFLAVDKSATTPLSIHSIIVQNKAFNIQKLEDVAKESYDKTQQVLELQTAKNFSILTFMVPASKTTNDILAEMSWVKLDANQQPIDMRILCHDEFQPGRIQNAWDDWDLLIVTTDAVLEASPEKCPKNECFRVNMPNNLQPLKDLMVHRIRDILIQARLSQQQTEKH